MKDDEADQPDPSVMTPPPIEDAPSTTGVVADEDAVDVDEGDDDA